MRVNQVLIAGLEPEAISCRVEARPGRGLVRPSFGEAANADLLWYRYLFTQVVSDTRREHEMGRLFNVVLRGVVPCLLSTSRHPSA